jgi:hypothetical protein
MDVLYAFHYLLKFSSFLQGPIIGQEPDERLSMRQDKDHVLYGGTKILQYTPDKVAIVMLTKTY